MSDNMWGLLNKEGMANNKSAIQCRWWHDHWIWLFLVFFFYTQYSQYWNESKLACIYPSMKKFFTKLKLGKVDKNRKTEVLMSENWKVTSVVYTKLRGRRYKPLSYWLSSVVGRLKYDYSSWGLIYCELQ